MSGITMTDIETIRDALVELSVRGFEATANDALRTLSRIERVVEAARWVVVANEPYPGWRDRMRDVLREALGALDEH